MTAKAEGLSPALTGKFSLNDARNGRRENNFGATITTVQSAACNSVVLAAASDRHKNYSALRSYPLREKNG
jgi:hypothetical protein